MSVVLPIVQLGDPVLRNPTRALTKAELGKKKMKELIDAMRETMRAARKPIAVWGAADLDLNVDALRRRSRIERVFTPAKQGQCAFISGSAQEQAATFVHS